MAAIMKCKVKDCHATARCRGWCDMHYTRWRRHGDPKYTSYGHAHIFLDKAIKYKGANCVFWPFGRSTGGYAQIHVDGVKHDVHRLICKRVYGPPPTERHWSAHSCGNGHLGCISPQHLRWATPKENHADKKLHGTNNHGSRNGNAKLSESDVREILRFKEKRQGDIAAKFGITQQTVSDIQRRRSWRHI